MHSTNNVAIGLTLIYALIIDDDVTSDVLQLNCVTVDYYAQITQLYAVINTWKNWLTNVILSFLSMVRAQHSPRLK